MESLDSSQAEGLIGVILILVLFILILYIAFYVLTSIFLNNVHKRIYGNGTFMAWVPFCKTYLLGQLAVNKLVGIILVSASVLSDITVSTGTDGETTSSLLPGVGGLVSLATIVFYIMLLVKNGKLKRGELSPELAKRQCDAMNFNKVEDVPAQTAPPVNAMPEAPKEETVNAMPEAPKAAFCPNCGTKLPEESAFCTNCGGKIG